MGRLRRIERLIRGQFFGSPFKVTNLFTHYEIEGQDNLEWALALRDRRRVGMITVSNHLSLFDDPLVVGALLGLKHYNNETKIWWSTPCESNFNPRGNGLTPRLVRTFSEVSNMVFFARRAKKGRPIEVPSVYGPVLSERAGLELMQRLESRCQREGLDLETFLARYVTQELETGESPDEIERKLAPMNQAGMVEACARVGLGDWLHFFPEGTRSRNIHLKQPKRGVGKVIHHNPDAIVLPFCFYGSQDVMPVDRPIPRPFKKIVVTIGEPIIARDLIASDDAKSESPFDSFQRTTDSAWQHVVDLRPMTLARYLGPAQAEALLRAEAPAKSSPAGEAIGSPARPTPIPERPVERRPGKKSAPVRVSAR